jgi:hypothetical protein
MSDKEKAVEILLLRIVERKQKRGPDIPRWQKVPLAALAVRLKEAAASSSTALKECIRLFKPDTLIGWHRAAVRLKWTFKQERKRGRPPIDDELECWILRVARENPGLGYEKLEGEMRKLGFDVSHTTIRTVMNRHGLPPPSARPARGDGSSTTTRISSWPATSLPWKR